MGDLEAGDIDVHKSESGERSAYSRAVPDVGAVRIAVAIGEGVVLAMIGDP